jgi:hypothetical protein
MHQVPARAGWDHPITGHHQLPMQTAKCMDGILAVRKTFEVDGPWLTASTREPYIDEHVDYRKALATVSTRVSASSSVL